MSESASLHNDILNPCVPAIWVRAFNIVLFGTAFVLSMYAFCQFKNIQNDSDPEIQKEKMKMIASAVSTMGVIIWPIIWDYLIGYSVIVHRPLTLFGFLWPIVINMLDLFSINSKNIDVSRIFGIGSIATDANTLVGVAFAIGSLLASQSNQKLADATIPIIMYSLLLLIAFIVPTPSLDPTTYEGFTAASIKRVFFNYAMGLIITGISINVSTESGKGLQKVIENLCKKP